MIEQATSEVGRTISVPNLPASMSQIKTYVEGNTSIEVWVERVEVDDDKFTTALLVWNDGLRIFLDKKGVSAMLATLEVFGPQTTFAMLHEFKNRPSGAYLVID